MGPNGPAKKKKKRIKEKHECRVTKHRKGRRAGAEKSDAFLIKISESKCS